MAHLRLVIQGEELGIDLVLAQGREAQRGDELSAGGGEDRPHRDARLAQQPHQFEALVGGDPAAHDQENPLFRQGFAPPL